MKSSHNNIFCLEITDLYNTILPLTWNLCTWEKTQKVHKRSFGWDSWVCNKHSWWRGSVNIWPLRFVHEWPPTTLSGMCLHICIDSSHWANLIGLSLSATCSAFIPWGYISGCLWVSHWFLLWFFSWSFHNIPLLIFWVSFRFSCNAGSDDFWDLPAPGTLLLF